jgi:hypothetical protein
VEVADRRRCVQGSSRNCARTGVQDAAEQTQGVRLATDLDSVATVDPYWRVMEMFNDETHEGRWTAGRLLQWSNRRDAVEVVASLQDRGVQSSGGAEPGVSMNEGRADSVDPGKSRRCLSTDDT